jgi:hypothetical protein
LAPASPGARRSSRCSRLIDSRPVWLDTAIALSSGDSFTVPVGHSHHAWRIRGPVVDTRVMFYLGTSGTAFFGQTDARPAWSGTIAATDVTVTSTSGADYDCLLATVDTAATYLRRNRVERATVAAACPPTATATSAFATTRTPRWSSRRAARSRRSRCCARRSSTAPDLGEDDIVHALPKDGDGLVDPADALRRAVAMQPFPDGSPLMGSRARRTDRDRPPRRPVAPM